MEDNVDKKVIKDISEYFNIEIVKLMMEIKESNQEILTNIVAIRQLNHSIHELYKKLHPYMISEEIEEEKGFIEHLGKLRPLKKDAMEDPISGGIVNAIVGTKDYKIYRALLEDRELHLNRILKRSGLSPKQRDEGKRLR